MFKSMKAMVAGLMVMGMGVREGGAQIQFNLPLGSLKYGSCADVKKSDFSNTVLVNKAKVPDLFEPVRFAVSKTGRIFFVERNGGVRVVETNGEIKKLGTITVFPTTTVIPGNNELGLEGIELDPNFETNGLIYLMYQPPTPAVTKVSRFKVTGSTLDISSEQVIMQVPNQRAYCCHTGGGMQFDNKGDLWITMGNNTRNSSDANGYIDESNPDKDDQAHAANTNDYRGKTLRIHPTAAAGADGKFYTIPAGNMKEYYASVWGADAGKVLPEIYTMGHRSNWSLSVDTVKGWLTWGDVGPDESRQTEEFNVTAKPGFFGWPYWAGSKRDDAGDPYAYKPLNKDENAPTNTSKNNTGSIKLPPAIPATFGYRQAAAIAGPIYHWSSAATNPKRLPPHFDNKWLITDFNIGQLQVATLDNDGKLTGRVTLIDGLVRPIHMAIGHDGILYTLEYAQGYFVTDSYTALRKWEYNGAACQGVSIADAAKKVRPSLMMELGVGALRSVNVPAGSRGFSLYDVQGKVAWSWNGTGAAQTVAVPASVANGLYRVVMR